MPEHAFGEHHLIGENDALVEVTIAICVIQTKNAMRTLLQLDLDFLVRSARIGDVEPPPLVKVAAYRAVNHWRSGYLFDRKPRGQRERMPVEFELVCPSQRVSRRYNHEGQGPKRRLGSRDVFHETDKNVHRLSPLSGDVVQSSQPAGKGASGGLSGSANRLTGKNTAGQASSGIRRGIV